MQPKPTSLAADLLRQLHEARTPLARVRLVARAWRTVRSLSPKERMAVAAQLGLDGADDLVEAVAAHQGTAPPPELMKAVNEVQHMDPATLQDIVARVRDPQQRGQAVRDGLQALGSALAGPPPAPSPPEKPAATATATTVEPAASWPLREAPAPVPPAPPPPAPPPAPDTPPPPPAPVAAPAPVIAPSPEPPASSAEPVPARAAEPAAVAPARGRLAERLSSTPALTARFHLLRRRLDDLRRLSPAELRGVLEAFPDGWARRRALCRLIEAGIPERVTDALALVDALQSPAGRAWCLGALADLGPLAPEEQEAILQAASTPAGRRRLKLRMGVLSSFMS